MSPCPSLAQRCRWIAFSTAGRLWDPVAVTQNPPSRYVDRFNGFFCLCDIDSLESSRESVSVSVLWSSWTLSGVKLTTGCLQVFSHSTSRADTWLLVVIPILHRIWSCESQVLLETAVLGPRIESSINSQGSSRRWPSQIASYMCR